MASVPIAQTAVAGQAAISAVLVATLPSAGGVVPTRLLDTLVGGAIGLAVLIVAPRNPLRVDPA